MLKTIYAIEISGICNLQCSYCPYGLHQRARGLMDRNTLERVVDLISSGTLQAGSPLHLHLFGEPLLHPQFLAMARRIKEVATRISFSTNGTKIDYRVAQRMAEVGFAYVTVSPHDKQTALKAAYLLRARGVRTNIHPGPDHNWGGQVDHKVKWWNGCEFCQDLKVVVRWNGDVAVCCISDGPEAVIGTVWDEDLKDREHKEIELCKTCHLKRKGARYEQGQAMPDAGRQAVSNG